MYDYHLPQYYVHSTMYLPTYPGLLPCHLGSTEASRVQSFVFGSYEAPPSISHKTRTVFPGT